MQDKNFWDDIYRKGLTPWTDAKRDYCMFQQIVQDTKVAPQMKVLDYGCAEGTIGEHLLNMGIRVDFSEISEIPVEILRKKFGDISKVFLATEPKEIDGKYDLIVCCCVLHHIEKEKWYDFLLQFKGLLRGNGLLWLAGFDKNDKTTERNQGKFLATSDTCQFISEIVPIAETCEFEVISNYAKDIPNATLGTSFTTRFICLRLR
ncbi:MAG: class I SAM-dependent methyltransferase [Alphaproteobacteria bacterium]|nr:class I SAM-dependent methyltransferase [Alphaproteobacteria bacterium]